MSTRVSQVYGESKGYHWHGWTECFEGDWIYLDISGHGEDRMMVRVNDDEKTAAVVAEVFVRMPLEVFDCIARQYVERKSAEAAVNEQIEREWRQWESETGKCAWCCKWGPEAEERCRPTCTHCGGSGKATP